MGPTARIDLSALRHNLQRARELAPGSRVYAVIKANAYGHGMLRVAPHLAGADALAVARVEEAVKLRQAGIDRPILVLEGFFDAAELAAASHYRLEVAVQQPEQIALLHDNPLSHPLTCWLKIDSGMHRLGFQPDAVEAAWQALQDDPSVDKKVRLMTHLSSADDLSDPATPTQLALFSRFADRFGTECSVANSAGIIGWPEARSDWIRPGIMLYGASPMLGQTGEQIGLRSAMTLQSRLIAVNRFAKGSPIGYSGSWVCPEAMSVGVVAAGYGDGYPRHAPSGTPVLLNGQRVPLVGRVSMDMLNIDLRSQPDAKVGDPVTLWGEGLPAEEIAQHAGTIAYELFCGVTQRVQFEETNG
ncbi:alanine racemase [Sedimenticola sp.]|uniref:alanine racemase n=1 Tax=Sedimenticola sp. TaxID=1940285 RepID=UPI003D133A8D